MRFRYPFIGIAIILAVDVPAQLWLYERFHWFDIPMHFAGGVVIAMLAMALWDRYIKSVTFTEKHAWQKRAFFTFCVVGFTAIIGIAWEWFEFAFDMFVFPYVPQWGVAQPSVTDTMADFFFDLSGACLVAMTREKV